MQLRGAYRGCEDSASPYATDKKIYAPAPYVGAWVYSRASQLGAGARVGGNIEKPTDRPPAFAAKRAERPQFRCSKISSMWRITRLICLARSRGANE